MSPSFIYMYIYMCVCVYVYTHTHNGILLIKKNEIMPFVATWMNLEMIMLSEVSQRQIYNIAYMWNLKKKMIQMNLYTEQTQTCRHRKQTYDY